MEKRHIELRPEEEERLGKLVAAGVCRAQVFRRATALLELNRGKELIEVARTLDVSRVAVARWRDRYKACGLKCLEDAPRPGRPVQIDGLQRAKITALACSQPPEGQARWTLRLLADKAVELGYCESLSHTEVATILKAMRSSPISRRPGAWGR